MTEPIPEDRMLATLADLASVGGAPEWADITGKPATFPPATHSHSTADVTGLDTALAGKADAGAEDTAMWSGVSGKPATFPPTIGSTASTAKAGNYVPSWSEVTSKPTTFPPIIGTTSSTAKAGNYQPTWAQVTGKPSTFPPATHSHTAAEVGAVARSGSAVTLWSGTQAQYDALAEATRNAAGFIAVITA